MKKILFSCLMALGIGANAQTTFFTEDFENASTLTRGDWTSAGFGTLAQYPYNTFYVVSSTVCPNNYITGNSMAIIALTSSSSYSCNYGAGSTANASYSPLIYKKVDASSYTSLLISYKWKCNGQITGTTPNDYGQLVYSTDGTTWTNLGSALRSGTTETQTVTDYALPAALDNKTFYIGWRFYYNTSTQNQPGFVIDDIAIKGTAPATCSGAPNTTTASITYSIGPVGTNNTLTAGGASAGGGISYEWQISEDGTTWNAISGATTLTYVTTAPNLPDGTIVHYRLKTNCSDSGQSSYSNTLSYQIDKYCVANVTANDHAQWEKIANVTFSGINNSSESTAGFENFTSIKGSVEKEKSYPISVSVSKYDSDITTVWIDFNQNGVLGDVANEKFDLVAGTADGEGVSIATGNITIPADAVLGNTRMRVRTSYQAAGAECGNTNYGQVEDYTVEIKEFLAVNDINKTNISVYPNPFVDIVKISNVKDVKSISINDASGRQVKSLAPASELNLSGLKSGLYIINLNMTDGSVKPIKAIKK